ncbi:hypothetical protein ACHAWU_000259 [Discostella pseudostelligera]|uniref:Uncharacterized protein n=1 Tax=Discostella pseudostelligera TaxID=259834 RepID=A0ABD3MAZ3_9STRA
MIYFTFFIALFSLVASVAQANGQQDLAAVMDANQGGIFAADEELPSVVLLQQQEGNKSTKSGKKATAVPGFVISGRFDQRLEIVSCDPSSVEVKGSQTEEIKPGNILINAPHSANTCNPCNPLFRKVQSISTSPITPGIQQDGSVDASVSNMIDQQDDVLHDKNLPPPPSEPFLWSDDEDLLSILSTPGSCNDSWLRKNSDGSCSATNCYVGVDGDPNDCFVCNTACDIGCGAVGSVVFNTADGTFYDTYDFGSACCHHDFCWSSRNSKEALLDVVITLGFPVSAPFSSLGCDALAYIFYAAVSKTSIGDNDYAKARSDQENYELECVCNADAD